ncbi:MAG: hypothetical protein KAS82_04350 [Bacteroidales bacterium]|nr:hypothetical protein [Bacteroidales bacterium]
MLFFTGLFLLLVLPAEGQLIRVHSEVSRDSLMIGDQIHFTLRVDADREVEFMLPHIKDTLSNTLEVLSQLSSDTTVSEKRRVVEQSYIITVFESGSQIVPSQEVIYNRGGVVDTARSMPLIINVYEPAVDTTQQIKPIKPPINTPVTFMEVLPWAGAGLGGLLIAGVVVWLLVRFLKRKRDPEGHSLKPLEPAHVIAFRELDRLKNEKIWTKGKVKQYYISLTEITRRYIERQYDIPAMESTTEEILHAFRTANQEDNLLDEMLRELLELADLVKFAREDPLPVDNQTNLNNAYIFVQKTYPLFYRLEEKKEAGDE